MKSNELDKFYTNPNILNELYSHIKQSLHIDFENDFIIEPSAGNGSFINIIKLLCKNHKFYDIAPEHDNIIQEDFLKLKVEDSNINYHVIGNPPFGRQSSLALKFIRKSCEFCKSISFILPKSFKKDSMKNKIPLNFHCIFEIDLAKNSFLVDDEIYDVPCVFQIWMKKNHNRTVSPKYEPIGYQFVKKNEHPDISFRRVGVYAGNISHDFENKSEQSHYFIKFKEHRVSEELITSLNSLKFHSSCDTVGPKSISKQEAIVELNTVFASL